MNESITPEKSALAGDVNRAIQPLTNDSGRSGDTGQPHVEFPLYPALSPKLNLAPGRKLGEESISEKVHGCCVNDRGSHVTVLDLCADSPAGFQ